jgi:heme exporter protein B
MFRLAEQRRHPMKYLKKVAAIVAKDIAAELRTREMLSSMGVFAILVIIIFNFALELTERQIVETATPGALWVTIVFAGMLGLNRSLSVELDKGCLDGLLLAPVDRSAIFLGKALGNALFMLAVEIVVLPLFGVFFNVPLMRPWVILIVVLGTLGFAGVGTLLSSMAVNTRAREVMLPILLFPVAMPELVAAVKATAGAMAGLPVSEWQQWLNLLIVFDVVLIAVSFMVFEYIVEE